MRVQPAFLSLPFLLLAAEGTVLDGRAGAPSPTNPCAAAAAGAAPRAAANDNRRPAGTRRGDTLVLSLVIAPARWYPEAEDGCSLEVLAFAEEGRAPTVPGPLVRAAAGTIVRARVRNASGRALWLRGLHDRPAPMATPAVALAPDSTRDLVFTVTTPGTYAYQATLAPYPAGGATIRAIRDDAQLVGALVVDPPGATDQRRDRILVITRWAITDTTRPVVLVRFALTAMNGRSWPHTERLEYAEGDSVRWRVINATPLPHPMHLHGFYFDVTAKGTAAGDTALVKPRFVVTEIMAPWQTMQMRWHAERPGQWLFHCHLLIHMSPRQRVERVHLGDTLRSERERLAASVRAAQLARGTDAAHHHAPAAGAADHATHGMGGIILGINVRPRRAAVVRRAPEAPRRQLRLFANVRATDDDTPSRYGFVLQDGPSAPAMDSVRRPGSPIVLRRGEPVQITVFNRLATPLSVHWHGLELDSFFDGVGGFSGSPGRIAPPIAPGDSFVVRLTPPRAGTFMYHVHGEDGDELAQGLYGPLLVVDDPAARDTMVDHVLLVSDSSAVREHGALVNGSTAPPITLVAGRAHRLRVIGITGTLSAELVLRSGADTVRWRMLARDGAEVGGEPSTPARVRVAPGTIADYELVPTTPGTLTLQVTTGPLNNPAATVFRRWTSPITVVAPPVALGARR